MGSQIYKLLVIYNLCYFVMVGSILVIFFCIRWRTGLAGCSRNRFVQLLTLNQFLPTIPTFAVRETDVSRHNGGTLGVPLKPLRDDSALRALSTLEGFKGAPAVPPLCRETQSLGQQMLERWA